MKIYKSQSVYDEALDRIRFIFDEFDNVIVNFSGGKDSTVVFHLAMKIAEEKNRLPLKVLFLDQESEWEYNISYVRKVMNDKRVEPMWFQMPMKIFNASSHSDNWLECWGEGKEWIREKEPNSIKENKYGTDRFGELFSMVTNVEFPKQSVAKIGGVRCEESPSRQIGLTNHRTYKWVTWGKQENKKYGSYTFYPIYDWGYTDIWKAIYDNKWEYCKIYDFFYQYGVPIREMRISSFHHETAIKSMFILQEIEPDTWSKLTKRLNGANTVSKIGREDFFANDLPFMFKDWREYRDYLLENLIKDDLKELYRSKFKLLDERYEFILDVCPIHKVCVQTLMVNDYHWTKLKNYENNPDIISYRRYLKTKELNKHGYNRYVEHYIRNYELQGTNKETV